MAKRRFNKGATGVAMQHQQDIEDGVIQLPEVQVNLNRIHNVPTEYIDDLYDAQEDKLYNPLFGEGIVDPDRKALMEWYEYGYPRDTMIYDMGADSVYTSGHLPRMPRTPGFEQAVDRYKNLRANHSAYYSPSWRSRFNSLLEFLNPIPGKPLSNQKDVEIYYPKGESETNTYWHKRRRAQERNLNKK